MMRNPSRSLCIASRNILASRPSIGSQRSKTSSSAIALRLPHPGELGLDCCFVAALSADAHHASVVTTSPYNQPPPYSAVDAAERQGVLYNKVYGGGGEGCYAALPSSRFRAFSRPISGSSSLSS